MSKTYRINEVFYSVQGEGVHAGRASVFLRFTGCNMKCQMEAGPKSPGGFDCDTEFESGRAMTIDEVCAAVVEEAGKCRWIIASGGEPALQLDSELVRALHDNGFQIAIETNGSVEVCPEIDWITVSPKVAEHAIKQTVAHEVKYVRGYGQALPRTAVKAQHYLISPATNGLTIDRRAVEWCVGLVKENPSWRLSVQMHKSWIVR
jgi:7-carboxy-7-deazaguanine synthase